MAKKNKSKKPEVPDKHFASDDESVCVYEVYKKSNKTIYYFRDSRYLKYTDKLTLQGYTDLPAGLYLNKKGYGFGKKGILLLIALKEQLAPRKNLEVVIIRKGKKSINNKSQGKVRDCLPRRKVRVLWDKPAV